MSLDLFEQKILSLNKKELIVYLMAKNYINKEHFCARCNQSTKMVEYKRNVDGYAWRCMTSHCKNYKKYFSIRISSFFDKFSISFQYIFRIIIKYACKTPRHAIILNLDVDKKTILKVIDQLVSLIPKCDFTKNKLGGPGFIVQIDETMLNYKAKSHRGRFSLNKKMHCA